MTDRHTALGIVNATAGPLVAAGACTAADVSPVVPVGIAAAAGAGLLARHWLGRVRSPWSEAAFKASAALSGGAWAAWSTITGPWHVPNLAVGAGAAILGALLAPAFIHADPPQYVTTAMTPAAAGALEPPTVDDRALAWKPRIERICRVKPITITKIEDWPNGAGYTLKIRFAAESGDTWKSIDSYTFQLAGAAYLPKGCVIGVSEGDRQGTAEVRIPTVNALGETDVWMSPEVRRASINDDHSVAIFDDTGDAMVNLRQEAGLIVSRRGGGKTNLLNRLICRLLECDDNVTWIVDLNGGGLAVPFLMPWIDGEVDRCPIDAIAVDERGALLMAEAAAEIARDRKARYARLKARANTDLLPVSSVLPQITIVIDEAAEVLERAPKAFAKFLEVQRIGRAEAVNVEISALRGTQDTIPVPVRKQAVLKVCGVVESDGELDYVIPGTRLRSADLVHAGTMYLSRGKGARQIKVHRTNPRLIAAVVRGTDAWRASLDTPAEVVAGEWYATRWEKLRPWLDKLREEQAGDPGAPLPANGQGDSPLRGLAEAVAAGHVQADDATKETLRKALDADRQAKRDEPMSPAERDTEREQARESLRRFAARQAAEERLEQMDSGAFDDAFNAVVAGLGPSTPAGPGSESATSTIETAPRQWDPEMLIAIVRDNPGITPKGMLDVLAGREITVSEKTLFKWLDRYVQEKKLDKRDGGKYVIGEAGR